MNIWFQKEQELAEGRRRANFIVTSGAFTLILLAAFLGFTLGQCMKCIWLRYNFIYEIMSSLKLINLNFLAFRKIILCRSKGVQVFTYAHFQFFCFWLQHQVTTYCGSISHLPVISCSNIYIRCLYPPP